MTPPSFRERLDELRYFVHTHEEEMFFAFVFLLLLLAIGVLYWTGHSFYSLPAGARVVVALVVAGVGIFGAYRIVGISQTNREHLYEVLIWCREHERLLFVAFLMLGGAATYWLVHGNHDLPTFLSDQNPVPRPVASPSPSPSVVARPSPKPSASVGLRLENRSTTRLDVYRTTIRNGPQPAFLLDWQVRLVQDEATRRHVDVGADDVKAEMTRLHADAADPQARQQAQVQACIRRLLLDSVTDEQLRHTYQALKEDFDEYEVLAIVVQDKYEADEVRFKLHNGATFESLGSIRGIDDGSRKAGGQLGYLTLPMLRRLLGSEVADVIPVHPLGTVTGPLDTRFGHVIIMVRDSRANFEAARPLVEDALVEAGRDALLERLETVHSTQAPLSSWLFAPPKANPRPSLFANPTGLPR